MMDGDISHLLQPGLHLVLVPWHGYGGEQDTMGSPLYGLSSTPYLFLCHGMYIYAG